MATYLDFEKPIEELEKKIEELRNLSETEGISLEDEIKPLEKKLNDLRKKIFSSLTPWQKVQLARHPDRPYTLDYINLIFNDWVELHGDRLFADDPAIVSGFATLEGIPFTIVGHQKGRTVEEKIKRNFGMPHPEGYRKALRVMKTGAKFGRPIIAFIDTPGAFPGIGAEERGQAMAIAVNIKEMAVLPVPIIVIVTGEGGSGGALAIGVGDRVYMQENAMYSVISPEGCASILWRDQKYKDKAAESLKITAKDLLKMGVIDGIIPEPPGGAHRDPEGAAKILKKTILNTYRELSKIKGDELIIKRIEKFGEMGFFKEV
ncbi:MAG TPA: acetyl-CoA carboxylase carboxyltransferase subunit alpha [candidate division WOR-3 bacterium]|uniref:Acetyl-coenzyme A carboxylase carboxyl transferase subunit alpha n=1 Tax=candidate division WOR-3 bacterium TaxID=2052148 RepID=A0A7C0ZA68_UNCW3|nr:acetyl-CoA carboxylase carboxyltransferase subunit alpha [candidate division WOR-3 bacterium]